MEKLEYNGEIYYYYNNQFIDEYFIVVSDEICQELAKLYFGKIDYKKLSDKELLDLIQRLKCISAYPLLIEMCSFGLKAYADNFNFVSNVLPILSSTYRNLNLPDKAIQLYNNYYYGYYSVYFLTSIAAAYCDLHDYKKAKEIANKAYAMQGGGLGYKNELSLVYQRIDKESE